MHVLDSALADHLDDVQLEALKNQCVQRITQETKALCADFDIAQVQPIVLVGSADLSLVQFAEAKRASLLVVASQGHSTSPLYRLGGVSERVAVASQAPVLVVRDAAPFIAWARSERPLRIMVGLDFSASSDPAVRLVKTLRQAGACDVVFAHVHYWYDVAARYGMSALAGDSLVDSDKQTNALLTRDLSARVGQLEGEGTVRFLPRVGVGRLGDHLLELAEAEQADLIAVGTHRRSGVRRLASVSSVVLHYSHVSVACVPPGETELLAAPLHAPKVRRVLIPTDLSSFSNHALAHGYGQLSERGGEVHLLHVVTPDASTDLPKDDADLVRQLRALVPSWAAERGIVTRTEVVHRKDVGAAVQEAAARMPADLVCVASHGRSGLLRAVLGSTGAQIVRDSRVPVLIVRPPAP